jgi:hypothetical protein
MKKAHIIWAMSFGMAWGATCALGQPRSIQPSPAYYPQAPAVQPVPVPQPTDYAPPPAQPVYSVPQGAPLTLAPAPAFVDWEEEEEDGLYWFWGQKWPGLALGAKIGTTGLGADLVFGINRFVNLRSGFNYGLFTWNVTLGDVDYKLESNLMSTPLLVDIHPFAGHFRISGGLYFQPGSKADISATPDQNVQIGNHTYPPDVVGTLNGEIEIADTVAPYVGIGFGNAVGEDQMLTFMLDLGVVFQSYDVTLTSNGAGMTTKLDTFRKDLEVEEAALQEDLDSFKVYPVITFGIAYHF